MGIGYGIAYRVAEAGANVVIWPPQREPGSRFPAHVQATGLIGALTVAATPSATRRRSRQ